MLLFYNLQLRFKKQNKKKGAKGLLSVETVSYTVVVVLQLLIQVVLEVSVVKKERIYCRRAQN